MTGWRKRTIMEMAKKAGFIDADWNYTIIVPYLERFEALVREDALAQPAPVQEPAAWKETDELKCPLCGDKGFPWPKCGHITYLERTTPPQRPWVGLTDEEVSKLIDQEIGFNSCWGPEEAFARAIEAKLKEKNT